MNEYILEEIFWEEIHRENSYWDYYRFLEEIESYIY
jgi:hypothetical protein